MRLRIGGLLALVLCLQPKASFAMGVKLAPLCKVVDVPADATFVVEERLGQSSTATSPTRTTSALPANYNRVTVSARVGDTYKIYPLGMRCMGPIFRVTKAPVEHARFRPTASWSGNQLELSWKQEATLGWTQVDWAYSDEHLDNGWSATRISKDATISLPTVGAPVALRLTRHRIDGSVARWQGWTAPNRKGLQRGPFPQPSRKQLSSSKRVAMRTVPTNPSFYFDAYQFPQWIAIRGDDTVVRTSVQPSKNSSSLVIRVPLKEGQSLHFLELPLKPGWKSEPLLRATKTSARRRDPIPPVVVPPWGGYSDYVGTLELDIANRTQMPWGQFEIDWALTRDALGHHAALSDDATELIFYNDNSIFADGRPTFPRDFTSFFIRVTPIWDHGIRGTPFEGRVDREPDSETVTLTPL